MSTNRKTFFKSFVIPIHKIPFHDPKQPDPYIIFLSTSAAERNKSAFGQISSRLVNHDPMIVPLTVVSTEEGALQLFSRRSERLPCVCVKQRCNERLLSPSSPRAALVSFSDINTIGVHQTGYRCVARKCCLTPGKLAGESDYRVERSLQVEMKGERLKIGLKLSA